MSRSIPKTITAGVTFTAAVALPAYSNGWDVTLHVRGAAAIDLAATQYRDTFTFTASAADTAAWVPGNYAYTVRASVGADAATVESGSLTILPDLASLPAGADIRSEWQKGLEAIEAVLQKRATMDQERYRINNRELYRTPIADLIKLRAFYAQKVRAECCKGSGWGTVRVGFRPIGN